MNISRFSVKRPVTIFMAVLVVIILGTISLAKLPIDLLPNIEIPVAIVSTSYPNVGPEEVEKLITKPIEQSVGTVENIDSISSVSSEGNSIVIIQFNFGTDMDFATLKMREKIDMVKGMLPEDAQSPMVMKIDPNAQALMQFALTQKDNNLAEIQTTAEDIIEPRLERIPGVAAVTISGGYKNQVQININSEKLKGYNLSVDYISQILAGENLNMPGGKVKKGNKELLIRTIGEFKSIDEIRKIPIPLKTGGTVYLQDIGAVSLTHKDLTSISKTDGQNSINISIQKQSGTNSVEVANSVNKVIEELRKENSNIDIKTVFDQSTYIKSSINNVSQSAILGALLAVLVLFIFLRNIGSTFIIGTAIPISIIATFILIYFNGITLNLMTLGGLALGVGMLVDNSIVVLENIYRFRQDGYSRKDAAIKGTTEVTLSVIASTLTTVAVFLPIVFVKGITGSIFKELALTVTFSLTASLVVSLTLIPMLSSKILKVDRLQGKHHISKHKISSVLYDAFDKIFKGIENKYKHILSWALNHRKSIIFIALSVFTISMLSLTTVGSEFFPSSDEGQFTISVELPDGSKIDDTEKIVDEVESKIEHISEIDTIFSSSGSESSFSTSGNSENKGTLNVSLRKLEERTRSVDEVVDQVRNITKDIAGCKINVQAQSSGMGSTGDPISITIKGDDLDKLKELGEEFKKSIQSVNGTREVKSSLTDGIPEVQVKVNRGTASQYGITAGQIATQVKSIISGKVATKYKLNGDEIDVLIKGDEIFKQSISNLKQVSIQTTAGINVPLELLADVTIEESPTKINRDSQVRVVTISSQIFGRDLKSITTDIQKNINSIKLPNGYSYEFGGENKQMQDAFKDLALAFTLAVALIYMVLASQFESLIHPFTIMFSVPLAFAGGALGLAITNRTLCVPAIIGIIILAGIVVNNAIVLIDYINQRRNNGEERNEAILNVGPIRLRPIMMTTLTTVLGLLPMALGIGDGAETQAPMATVVIGGLLLSTLLTLVFIPVMYTIFDDLRNKFKRKKVKNNKKDKQLVSYE